MQTINAYFIIRKIILIKSKLPDFLELNMNSNLKMDINFLDKPLYFLNLKSTGKAFVWKDIDGYIYRSGYNVPDYFDMLILLYLVLKSQREGFKTKIVLTRCEILRECGLDIGKKHYKRVEESLRRWQNVSIDFQGKFYDGKKYKTILFGIIDDAEIREEDKRVVVKFNENWLLKVKESNFYKYLNFEFYKHLKKPVSRRLYELILPKCYDGKEWYIHATNLGHHLGIAKRQVKTRQGAKEVMYASDVLVAIKPAFKEINQLSTVSDICQKLKITQNDLFTLNYRVQGTRQDRILYIKKESVNSPNNSVQSPAQPLEFTESPFAGILPTICQELSSNPNPSPALPKTYKQSDKPKSAPLPATENLTPPLLEQYEQGIAWIKQTVPDFNFHLLDGMEKEKLATYFPKLKTKVEAEMKKDKINNPGAYLWECIRHQWELPLDSKEARKKKAEERQRQEIKKRQDKVEQERSKQERIEAEEKRFKERVAQLDEAVKAKLWEEAVSITPKNIVGNLHIPIAYSSLLLKHLNELGENFTNDAISHTAVIKAVAFNNNGKDL